MSDAEKQSKIQLIISLRDNPLKACGIYRHYKGMDYQLIAQAMHSETLEAMAVYKALYPPFKYYVRPWTMFFEIIEKDGQQIPRFERVL